MSLLRNVWADLVEKRLWPLVILLVAALAAVPLMLTRTAEPSGAAPPASQTAKAAGTQALALDTTGAADGHRLKGRNPFEQLHVPKPADDGTPDTAEAPSAAAPTTDSSPGADPGDSGATRSSAYRIGLRFGTPGKLRRIHDLERLAPLPSRSDPFFVFLGVRSDGKTAVFLVSSDAKGTGDGKCRPRPSVCSTVEMQAEDTEFFDLTRDDGSIVQYQLDLLSITKRNG